MASLRAETGQYSEESYTIRAAAGSTVANLASFVPSYLATMSEQHARFALINVGAVDIGSTLPDGATWRSNYLSIIDAVHARFPDAIILVAKPWRRGFDANADTVAGWIDTVVSSRSSFTFAGHDERVWLKGLDDGVTMTTDGIHYSSAGNTEAASQWLGLILPFVE